MVKFEGKEGNYNYMCMCVCVLERAKHSFFALPNPLSCSVMNKICINQRRQRCLYFDSIPSN